MKEPQPVNETSSIGATWPPVVTAHNRLRGFYDETVLRNETDIEDFAQDFEACRASMEELDRLTVRAVVPTQSLAILEATGIQIEGAIPLSGFEHKLVIAYMGWNRPQRRISEQHLAAYSQLLARSVERGVDTKDRVAEMAAKGYSPKVINGSMPERQKEALVPAFADMYGAFGYDQSDVEQILLNPDNTIAYIADGSTVISTSMAERGRIAIKGLRPFHIVEITEASTRIEYRRQGLYKAISGYLIQRLIEDNGNGTSPVSAIYGENNLAMPGVVFAASENGRRFSYFDAQSLGIRQPYFGILPQSFKVEDGVETRPYNDFALSYVPLEPMG